MVSFHIDASVDPKGIGAYPGNATDYRPHAPDDKLTQYQPCEECEDIYQRLFSSIWEKKSLVNVRERANISPWLVVLASNFTIDSIRKKELEENFLREGIELEGKSQNDMKNLLHKEERYLLDKAMKLLNKKERSYLELNYMSGKKHKEIALIFNTSINSVSTIIARAKGKIKKYIEEKNKKV